LLPTEILYTILRAVLDEIVECDMMISPKPEHELLPGGLSFPHTMALVCRYWRDVVFSAPVLWTRIFCVLPASGSTVEQMLSYQLEKTGILPVDLTIVSKKVYPLYDIVLRCIGPHIGRLRSLRISNLSSSLSHVNNDIITLPSYAPWLECLQLDTRLNKLLEINCPMLRTLHVNVAVAMTIDPQWLNNLTHVESVTISLGYSLACGYEAIRALGAIPRRIPSLTLDFSFPPYSYRYNPAFKIGAEKVIIHGLAALLNVIDDHCKTVVLRECNIDSGTHILPYSSTLLELDRCISSNLFGELTWKWGGDTVIITSSDYGCIQTILTRLNPPQASLNNSRELHLWSRVTTLKLVANGKFKMNFSVSLLRSVVYRRFTWDDAMRKIVENDEKPGNGEFKCVEPIRVLHVHGGPPLSRHMRSWFKKHVEDFVWDYKRS